MYFNNISGLKISLASPQNIMEWCERKLCSNVTITGEISEPLTLDFKTGTPEPNGLFCERIFGPIFSWQCKCGLYKNILPPYPLNKESSFFCEKCGVELNDTRIRRYRMGYIKLNTPIAHFWYIKSLLPLFLNLSSSQIESYLYYKDVFNIENISHITYNQLSLNKQRLANKNLPRLFPAEFFQNKLKQLNLLNELKICRETLATETNIKARKFLSKKAHLLHLFFTGHIKPEWIFLTILPVIPAGLRPFSKLNSGMFISSPLNDIYRNIIIRNNRLKRWQLLRNFLPINFELIEKLKLQESINTLFNNTSEEVSPEENISLGKSFQGKYGRFRQNILGKRVDYSGRSVIISGADLPFGNIGIPSGVALELFKPIILNMLRTNPTILTLLKATFITQYNPQVLKSLLKKLFEKEIFLVNRAPTLHRMNIQAFKPYLIEGEAFKLYPLACSSFNADFDGDQVGIFLPIAPSAKKEAKSRISFDKNIFSPSSSKNLFKPTQSIILGLYSLLNINKMSKLIFANKNDVIYAYSQKLVSPSTTILIRTKTNAFPKQIIEKKYILTTVGKVLLETYLQI